MKRVAFSILTILLALLFVELCSRFVLSYVSDNQSDLSRSDSPVANAAELAAMRRGRDQEVIHPYLGYVGNFDKNADRVAGGEPPYSSFGFLDNHPPVRQRSQDRLIVGVTGGSFAYNFTADSWELLSARLRDIPLWRDRHPVLVCLALGGYKQPQQLFAISYILALGGEFDIVLNIDGFNEVALHTAENQKKQVHPSFPRSWWSRISRLPGTEAYEHVENIATIDSKRRTIFKHMSAVPWRYMMTARLLGWCWDRQLAQERLLAETALRDYIPDRMPFIATGPAVDGEAYQQLAAIWRRSSQQLHRLCAANGIRYYHFLQPNQYLPDSKELTAEERRTAYLETHPYKPGVEIGYPLLIREGRYLIEAGVDFHDFTGIYRHVTTTLYHDTCCHVNRTGNDLVANAIGNAIATDVKKDQL